VFVAQIRNGLRISRRLPVPVETPLTVLEDSESEESVVELEEEEEALAEFPGIIASFSALPSLHTYSGNSRFSARLSFFSQISCFCLLHVILYGSRGQ